MSMATSRINFKYPSDREMEVLHLISDEFTINEIAKKLFISAETVKTHRRHLLKKMNVRNTAGLIRKSFESGILTLQSSNL